MKTLSTSTVGVKELNDRLTHYLPRLSRLAALGLITLPTRRTRQKPKPMKISGPPVSKAILDDRQ